MWSRWLVRFIVGSFIWRIFSNLWDDFTYVLSSYEYHRDMHESCIMKNMYSVYGKTCDDARRMAESPIWKLVIDRTFSRTHVCGDIPCADMLAQFINSVDNFWMMMLITFLSSPFILRYLYYRFVYIAPLPTYVYTPPRDRYLPYDQQ